MKWQVISVLWHFVCSQSLANALELVPASLTSASGSTLSANTTTTLFHCTRNATSLHLSDPPYENYFYSDCHSASQVVVTSPLPNSNLTVIGPRLLVAWPAGNSGLVAYFAPQNGRNGSLAIRVVNKTAESALSGVYLPAVQPSRNANPRVGITTLINFNNSAVLTVPIVGSIRTIRDFTEGPSTLQPQIQDALSFTRTGDGVVTIARLWLDNVTTTTIHIAPHGSGSAPSLTNRTITIPSGTYNFTAYFDYPQLEQLSATQVLNNQSQGLIVQQPDQARSLSFLSYSEKLLAGAWRFLTYFGRDSMISMLLLQPVLSEGNSSAVEAVIAAVLERINKTDGNVCHEETIGDYATFLNLQQHGVSSTAPGCTYPMVDTDFYLAPAMQAYFLNSAIGRRRRTAFFQRSSILDFGNMGMTYADLALNNAEKVMNSSAAFAQKGGQVRSNLIHLKQGQLVGQWRDSTYGVGGGRIPYDVNTALVPAALRAIAALSAAGFFPSHPTWNTTAARYAQVWEDSTLQFFQVTVPQAQAKRLVTDYTTSVGDGFPSHTDNITSDVVYHGLSLDGNNNQSTIRVMNTDDCFRHFLLNTTNQTQLTSFVNQTANNILRPFPAGLSHPQGLLIANPAYGGNPVYAANWTNNAYHGTVIWSWPMAMMAAGLQRQLSRCTSSNSPTAQVSTPKNSTIPDFCHDQVVHSNVLAAYNHLWSNLIDRNSAYLSNEVWSWVFQKGNFSFEALGALPPPPGQSPTESNIRQLWSLTFLAVTRDKTLK